MHGHWFHMLSGAAILWIFSAIVSSMPPLPKTAGYAMQWLYNALHAIAANLDKLTIPKSNGTTPP